MKRKPNTFQKNWGLLLLAFLLLGCGALLLLFPTKSMKTLCYIVASGTTLVGLVLMLFSLSYEEKRGKFVVLMAAGALTFVGGIVLFFASESIFLLFTALVGLLLVLSGGFALQTLLGQKTPKGVFWWIWLICSLLVILGGFLCIRIQTDVPKTLAFLLGVTLVLGGVQNIFSFLGLWERGKNAPQAVETRENK